MAKNTMGKILGSLTALLIALLLPEGYANAQNATAYTYTISVGGEWVRTQDAYLAGAILFKDVDLKKPEDIFIDSGKIYVADTGGGRIAIMDRKNAAISFAGEEILEAPTGVWVDNAGNMLIADSGLEKVVLLSPDGKKILKSYARPDSPVFGTNTSYKPRKAVSDKRGNIYIVSEGTYDGIIQLSREGEFLGYFGANITPFSPLDAMQNILFTEEQKAKLFARIPKTFYNIAIDSKGMIYSITQSIKGEAVKKHNVSGANILYEFGKVVDEENFVDIDIGVYGQIYAVSETGLVYEYDSTGSIIFSFGGRAISTERNGLFTVASGVAADENNCIYVLDKERGIVQVYFPTSFAEIIHEAMQLYENGKYVESRELWEEILRLSGISRIAHNGLGKAYFQAGDYEKAAMHFYIAQNRKDYSDAFWEIRNMWLQENAGKIIVIAILLIIVLKGLKQLDRRFGIFDPLRHTAGHLVQNRLIADVIYLKNIIKHPIDSFYYIRRDQNGSVPSATIIYILALVVFTADYLFRGFMFNVRDARETTYFYVAVLFLMPCALWVAGNYMVSSINEGEGRLKDVYCFTAYSFAPLILFMPFVVLLTYVATLNEGFVIQFSRLIIWIWCGVLLFIGIKQIHDYDIRDVFKNIFLTFFFMFMAVLAFSIIYMLWDQGIEFVYSVAKEVAYRVR